MVWIIFFGCILIWFVVLLCCILVIIMFLYRFFSLSFLVIVGDRFIIVVFLNGEYFVRFCWLCGIVLGVGFNEMLICDFWLLCSRVNFVFLLIILVVNWYLNVFGLIIFLLLIVIMRLLIFSLVVLVGDLLNIVVIKIFCGWLSDSVLVIFVFINWIEVLSYGCWILLFWFVVWVINWVIWVGMVNLMLLDLLDCEKMVVLILISLFVMLIRVLFEFLGLIVVLVWMKNW